MHKQMVFISKHVAASTVILCLVFMLFAWIIALPFHELFVFMATLACAAIPFGLSLAMKLQGILHTDSAARYTHHKKAVDIYFTACAAQVAIVLSGIVILTWWHIPAPLHVTQILAIQFVVLLFPVMALAPTILRSKTSMVPAKVAQPTEAKTKYMSELKNMYTTAWHGLLIGGLVSANYYWFFERNYLDAALVVYGSPDHKQALSLGFLTLALCLLAQAFRSRGGEGLAESSSREKPKNRQVWLATGLSLLGILHILYNPWISPYFGTVPLSLSDVGYSLGIALVYAAVITFHRHTKMHSRKAVLALHRKTMASK